MKEKTSNRLNQYESKSKRKTLYKCSHIDDRTRKKPLDCSNQIDLIVHQTSLLLTMDPNCLCYQNLRKILNDRTVNNNLIKEYHQDKLNQLEKYGHELIEFVKDQDGRLKSKYDKVFIT